MPETLARANWLHCPVPDASAPLRMWCVPFAGGGAAAWQPWARELEGLCEIVGLRLPGRETRFSEAPLRRIDEVVATLLPPLRPHVNRPYVLCGHSLGALVAFELAHAMRAAGLPQPKALIVAGKRAPHHVPDRPLLHGLAPDEFLAELERRYGPIAPEVRESPELLELLFPVLRADLEVYETYLHRARPPLAIPLLALGGEEDANVTEAQLQDWRAYTTASFEAVRVPGGHFFMQERREAVAPHVRRFLRSLA